MWVVDNSFAVIILHTVILHTLVLKKSLGGKIKHNLR